MIHFNISTTGIKGHEFKLLKVAFALTWVNFNLVKLFFFFKNNYPRL